MKQTTNNIAQLLTPPSGGRGAYITPSIEYIQLDNELSLALESASPPEGPGETGNNEFGPNNVNPFKELA